MNSLKWIHQVRVVSQSSNLLISTFSSEFKMQFFEYNASTITFHNCLYNDETVDLMQSNKVTILFYNIPLFYGYCFQILFKSFPFPISKRKYTWLITNFVCNVTKSIIFSKPRTSFLLQKESMSRLQLLFSTSFHSIKQCRNT